MRNFRDEEHKMKNDEIHEFLTNLRNGRIGTEFRDYIDERFKGAEFVVSCFKTIEEVDSKVLCDDDKILIYDSYDVSTYNNKTKKWKKEEPYNDYFLVTKQEGKDHIYYKDVIDVLIANNFIRNNCDHRYLESISKSLYKRRQDSIPVYGFFWGS
jgi:hypothetical protein